MAPRVLILETSHQPGLVALADGERVLGVHRLDEARRHARDLVPATAALLAQQGWKARDLSAVIVSQGPGSYTGLRVGLMAAKTLTYATGATLLGLPTFAAIARQAPAEAPEVAVLADAQQGKAYLQQFGTAVGALTIVDFDDWLRTCPADAWLTGPGLEIFAPRLPPLRHLVPREQWTPSAESLLALGLARLAAGERDDPFALEPLYLRRSSAEEKWAALGRK
jgi:tRNA threonylcarbamoyladenosine biosynthesis protein TsaB